MKSIYSKKLKRGDEIRIIAPASSVSTFKPKSLIKNAISRLNNLGFNVTISKNAYEKDIFGSSSIKSRIDDLRKAFIDKKVKAIICARGGFNSNDLLPHIDWAVIKNNPKPIIGYSDITVLSNAIFAKTGLIAYSGPSFSTLGMEETKGIVSYITEYFIKCLTNDSPYQINNSKYFSERKIKARKNKGYEVIQEGNATGTIIGGNLCSLNLLQGTEYMPSLKNSILFIEEDDFGGKLTPEEFSRNLTSLLQTKESKFIRGIVLGRFQDGAGMTVKKMKHIMKDKQISKSIPIIYNVDFGHTTPMIIFPIGGRARIEAKGKTVQITILKH